MVVNCAHCGSEFEKSGTTKYCGIVCRRAATAARRRARRQRDVDAARAEDRAQYRRQAERRKEYAKQYHYENREASLARMRARREADPERYRERNRRYYENNKPIYLEAARRRKHRIRQAKVIHFTAAQLESRLSMFPGCWMCGTSTEDMHVDHVKPIIKGGPHMLSNLRPACAPCNLRKGSKWPYPEQAETLDLGVAA